MLDWGPTYLKEVKHASLEQGGFSTAIYELGGMFSTVLMGWLSDKAGGPPRHGQRALHGPRFSWHSAASCMRRRACLWLDLTLFGIIGFFIYPPVMLLPVMGLDFHFEERPSARPRDHRAFRLSGTYVQGKGIGTLAERYGWNAAFYGILASTLLGILLLSWTWKLETAARRNPAAGRRRVNDTLKTPLPATILWGGPLALDPLWGRPPGRPAPMQEEPDLGVRRGRGRPPHIWLRLCCSVGQIGKLRPSGGALWARPAAVEGRRPVVIHW